MLRAASLTALAFVGAVSCNSDPGVMAEDAILIGVTSDQSAVIFLKNPVAGDGSLSGEVWSRSPANGTTEIAPASSFVQLIGETVFSSTGLWSAKLGIYWNVPSFSVEMGASPDGSIYLYWGPVGTTNTGPLMLVKRNDCEPGPCTPTTLLPDASLSYATMSKDGRFVAAVDGHRSTVTLIDTTQLTAQSIFSVPTGCQPLLAFSDDGSLLAIDIVSGGTGVVG